MSNLFLYSVFFKYLKLFLVFPLKSSCKTHTQRMITVLISVSTNGHCIGVVHCCDTAKDLWVRGSVVLTLATIPNDVVVFNGLVRKARIAIHMRNEQDMYVAYYVCFIVSKSSTSYFIQKVFR